MTDAQLIEKFRGGEERAFNVLVWRWEANLFNFVLRYLGDREAAKEACQKTFIRAFRKLDRLRDTSKFGTWLFSIAINICRDQLKAHKRRRTLSLEGLRENGNGVENQMEMVAEPAQGPDAQVMNRDVRHLLNRALQALPEEQRAVIVMKAYHDLKFTEIAEILDMSENTVKSRMYYGLATLRKIFKQWNVSKESVRYEV
ncbi:MAG: sigma-70 family RNA polymerase sigma factor [Calditrichaeota bacterium]|nr:MAG: sigma-70 family RNA polymerase sigma factor [Calditrichota bacterium]